MKSVNKLTDTGEDIVLEKDGTLKLQSTLNSHFFDPGTGNIYEVYDLNKLPAILNVEHAVEQINMTALNDYMLGNSLVSSDGDKMLREDAALQRLSLAYENLHTVPNIVVEELADSIQILDISNNMIDDLSFLSKMKTLSSLICDHNSLTSRSELPFLPNLELLWMNYCKITQLYPWCRNLRGSCPNLKYLSLMGNPAVPSYISSSEFYEYIQYRYFIISLFPRLIHLDEKKITVEERKEAERLYQRPLIDKLIPNANNFLRKTTEKLSDIFSSTPTEFKRVEGNSII